MALGTIISRITGLARNLLLVAALGTAIIGDTFQVANTLPTIIYILVAGGALNAVFVPQIVREMKSKDGGNSYASQLATATFTILGFATVIGILAAPVIVRLYAAKFGGSGLENEFELTVLFTRYCLPQVLFLGFFTLLGQIANARGSFGPMMWAPILNNLIVIGVLIGFIAMAPDAANGVISSTAKGFLGLGSSLGALVQAAILIPVIAKTGVRLRPNFHWSALRKSAHLAKWTLVFVAINQVGFMVIVNLATAASVRAKQSGIETGVGFTPYQNAHFIFMLPHSIIAVSFVTALLPKISRAAAAGEGENVKRDLVSHLGIVGAFTIPAGMAFLFLGQPIAHLLYLGADSSSAQQIGSVLAGFSLGIIPFSASYLLLRGFYAYEDTKTPAFITLMMNLVMCIFAFAAYHYLPLRWITVGIAVAFGIGYVASTFIASRILRQRIGALEGVLWTYAKLFLLALIAFLPSLIIHQFISIGNESLSAVIELLLSGVVGLSIYLWLGGLMKIEALMQVRQPLAKGWKRLTGARGQSGNQ
jgi:putative peptidoglycan lipid II flippase